LIEQLRRRLQALTRRAHHAASVERELGSVEGLGGLVEREMSEHWESRQRLAGLSRSRRQMRDETRWQRSSG
jgi:hypothetical protein